METVTFQASGNAIHTALIASDVVRRRIHGLHQINRILNITVKDDGRRRRKTSQEGGQENENQERNLTVFEITLHKNPS